VYIDWNQAHRHAGYKGPEIRVCDCLVGHETEMKIICVYFVVSLRELLLLIDAGKIELKSPCM
jgi:hypothetical protein